MQRQTILSFPTHSFLNNMYSADSSLPAQVINPTIIHYGHSSNYERFMNGSYFVCDTSYRPTIDSKESERHYVASVEYDTDTLYQTTDGHAGNCWKVKVVDNATNIETTYHIRNWGDIVQNYLRRGLKFVEAKN